MESNYRIGQTFPAVTVRGIVSGPEMAPVWHALVVAPQRERATRDYLRNRDIYAFYPSEEVVRTHRGKRLVKERPLVTQHVYAQFRAQPQWDVMQRVHRLITGVYARHGVPVEIHRDVIRHLQGLTVEADKLRAAKMEMLRVRVGDHARIISGPLSGFMVEVESIWGQDAWVSGLMGHKMRVAMNALERQVDLG